VFNKDTEQVVAILQGHGKKVTGVIYHPDEVHIVFSATPSHGASFMFFSRRKWCCIDVCDSDE